MKISTSRRSTPLVAVAFLASMLGACSTDEGQRATTQTTTVTATATAEQRAEGALRAFATTRQNPASWRKGLAPFVTQRYAELNQHESPCGLSLSAVTGTFARQVEVRKDGSRVFEMETNSGKWRVVMVRERGEWRADTFIGDNIIRPCATTTAPQQI